MVRLVRVAQHVLPLSDGREAVIASTFFLMLVLNWFLSIVLESTAIQDSTVCMRFFPESAICPFAANFWPYDWLAQNPEVGTAAERKSNAVTPEAMSRFAVLYPVVETGVEQLDKLQMALFSNSQGRYAVNPTFPKPSPCEFARI